MSQDTEEKERQEAEDLAALKRLSEAMELLSKNVKELKKSSDALHAEAAGFLAELKERNKIMDKTETAACAAFVARCEEIGSTPEAEEEAILSIGSEFLPECAQKVLRGSPPTVQYWEFLAQQTAEAQHGHDAEYKAGHDWHKST